MSTATTKQKPATTPTLAIEPANVRWKAGSSSGRLGDPGNGFSFTPIDGTDVLVRLGFVGTGAGVADVSARVKDLIRTAGARALEVPEAKRLEAASARLARTVESISTGKARLAAIEAERRSIDVLDTSAGERLAQLGREEGALRKTLTESESLLPQLRPAVHHLTETVQFIANQFGTEAAHTLLEQLGRQRAAILTELSATITGPLNQLLAVEAAMLSITGSDVVTEAVKSIVVPAARPKAKADTDDDDDFDAEFAKAEAEEAATVA